MVDILMATYNGGKYIEAQVLSIISQTFKDWRLIAHDDGSKDDTLAILKKWSQIDNRIRIVEDGIVCGGAAQNFMHLLKFSDADYVMFCDQDDIWFDNKIELMYNEINSMDAKRPRVVYSNSYAWFPNEGIRGLSTLFYASSMSELLFMNSGIQGCVSIFDSKVCDLLKEYQGEISMHDHLLHLIAVSLANISFINIPLMLYRNHKDNVTGDTRVSITSKSVFFKHRKVPVVDNRHFETVKRFRALYDSLLAKEARDILDIYLSLPDKSFLYRFYLLTKYQYKLYGSVSLLLVKCLTRPYIHAFK